MIGLGILVFIVATIVDVETDGLRIAKGVGVKHVRGVLLLVVPYALSAWLLGSLWYVVYLFCLRWLAFDYVLNLRNKQNGLQYIGETAWLDRNVLQPIGWKWGVVLKVGLIVASAWTIHSM